MAEQERQKQPVLELVKANKSWVMGDNRLPVLRDIDLEVFAGESLAIMGPSGSGKSTLLHVLGLLTTIDNGNLLFKGKPAVGAGINDKHMRRHFGFIFQDARLIPSLNVIDNVCVPLMHRGIWPAEQEKKAREILHKVGLKDRLYHYPNQLSGGEIMRVAAARALVIEPAVLLADEPTGSLDSHTGKIISELLLATVTPDMALVIVTHHQPLADCADRILYMQDGMIKQPPDKSFVGVQGAVFQKSPLPAGGIG